ncbi:fructosamine-3-kinase-like [Petromyzon marinus]|uniref:fructosamine-3-kinase-like n=1 Tax=Petromyzon marinus TaxID=7757 RepID=UPI003F70034D
MSSCLFKRAGAEWRRRALWIVGGERLIWIPAHGHRQWLAKASEAAARWASSTSTQPEGAQACWGSIWLKCTFTTGRLERGFTRKRKLSLNEWQEDWVTFFSRQRLQLQLDMIEKDYGERETRELWSRLQLRLWDFFRVVEVVPALLHGDLWTGNAAEINEGPVIFDPASFYGHSEYELAIAGMFQEL